MFSLSSMPSTTSVLSTYTTFAASVMLIRTMFKEVQNMTNQLIPRQLQEKILSKLGGLLGNHSSQMTLIIDEYDGPSINQVFKDSQIYLRTRITPSVRRLKVSKTPREEQLSVTINTGEKIIDTYEGIQLVWQMICTKTQNTDSGREGPYSTKKSEHQSIELSFDKEYKEKVLSSFLPYVLERSKAIQEETKVVKLHSLGKHGSVNLAHPSTFDTMAMDPTLKKELIDDLNRFVRRRKFYRRVGKAWKRGYLLYGPPGTGKSSLVAAMANYLKFDIYDLELKSRQSNSALKSLLLSTMNRSILVIEDIDCSVNLHNRQDIDCSVNLQNRQDGECKQSDGQLTLSGLLNFIDGLWSSCGDERIIVFTTNHKDRLDPALLRPGRMDMHIHMSYCTFCGFKILASNYLGITNHHMFPEIEKLVTEVEVTPAEIAEELMKSDEADIALGGLTKLLKRKRIECEGQPNDGGEDSEEIKKCGGKKVRNNKRMAKRSKRKSPRF